VRVVIVSKAFFRGAYQRKAEEIARLGVELTVLVPPGWHEAGRFNRLERSFTSGYDLIEIPILFNGHYHFHVYPTLGRWLDRLRPDLLHADEEPYNLATFLAYLAGGRVGARRVFFTWQNLPRRYPPPFGWMERWILAHSDGALAGNARALEILRDKGYRGPGAVVPQFGFDPELFRPADARPERPFTVGYLGRLEPQKGLDDLIRACAGLRGDWRLRLVGYGPQLDDLGRIASELDVGDRVALCPPVASTDVPTALHQMDVLVLPSRSTPSWIEQFGRVLPEAMACGVPTIGSDSGELPHVIGDAGLIFPEGDVVALRAQLQRLLDDPTLRADLSTRGRARFLERFTQEQVAGATVELYRAALGRS
jgi:glycosyltransferase involved in cell wall biosynthesis